jgi:hypothetical protein
VKRDANSGKELVFDGDLGELTLNGVVLGWVHFHVYPGGVVWEPKRWWALSREPEAYVEIKEWILVGAGRFAYNRDRSGPASAFEEAHRGEYALLKSQLTTGQAPPSDPLDEVTVALRWLRGEERLHKLAALDSWQPDPPAP